MKTLKKISFLALVITAIVSCQNTTKTNNETIETKADSTVLSESTQGFSKTLESQGFKFDVSTTGEGSIQQLKIQPYGLKMGNSAINKEIDGFVAQAEIGDLNADGFPELLIYTMSAGSGSYGDVIGYSVNEGKSIDAIYFPPIADNPDANTGYMGHDEFSIEELKLTHRFKTYNENDSNINPTGKTRQIQYILKDGKISRVFVIDKIIEY